MAGKTTCSNRKRKEKKNFFIFQPVGLSYEILNPGSLEESFLYPQPPQLLEKLLSLGHNAGVLPGIKGGQTGKLFSLFPLLKVMKPNKLVL